MALKSVIVFGLNNLIEFGDRVMAFVNDTTSWFPSLPHAKLDSAMRLLWTPSSRT